MAGDVLRDLFKKIVPEETRRSSEVFHGWENIVGAETALHVEPVDIRNHSLLLESDHPGWSQKIRMRQDGILKSIRNKYPELEIRSLKIRISNGKKDDSPKVETKQKESADFHSANEDDIAGADRPENDSAFFGLLEEMRRRADS